jgi:hypothetical protein
MVANEFNDLVYTTVGWRGAYPLVIPIQVGDYFELNKQGVPIQLGNAFNWSGWRDAVPVSNEAITGSETYYAGCKRKAVAAAGAGASLPGGVGADATLSLSFERSAGFALAYEAAMRSRVEDPVDVRRRILEAAKGGWWQENWIVVTEVIAAESATVVVATEKDSELDLHANASIPAAIAGVGIADSKLGWTASSWKGSGYSSVCKPGTPLYHCIKVRKGIFGRWRAELLDDQEPSELFTDDPFDA